MISQLIPIFGSRTKSQEIFLLLENLKPVVRQGFYPSELPAVEKFCWQNKLHLSQSKYKVLLADQTDYSNKGIKIPNNDPRQGMTWTYISKEEPKVLLAEYYELINNHQALGQILGYPACCVNYFKQQFNISNTNLQLPPSNPWTNLTLRDQDYVILSHFPCSSDCEASIELAKKYFSLLVRKDKSWAEELFRRLNYKSKTPQPAGGV